MNTPKSVTKFLYIMTSSIVVIGDHFTCATNLMSFLFIGSTFSNKKRDLEFEFSITF